MKQRSAKRPPVTGLLIAVPAFGGNMTAQTAESIFIIGQWLTASGVKCRFTWLSISDISESRNVFLSLWYDGFPEMSHLLFVDADMQIAPPLICDMLNFRQPLMGCLYARRQWPAVAVGKCLHPDNTVDDVVDGFLEVAGVGAGVMMISREVVDAMVAKTPEIVDTEHVASHPAQGTLASYGAKRIIRAFDPLFDERGGRLSEDLSFCERWRRCGGKVWANVEHMIGHIGPFNYAIRYADFLENKAREAAEKKNDAA